MAGRQVHAVRYHQPHRVFLPRAYSAAGGRAVEERPVRDEVNENVQRVRHHGVALRGAEADLKLQVDKSMRSLGVSQAGDYGLTSSTLLPPVRRQPGVRLRPNQFHSHTWCGSRRLAGDEKRSTPSTGVRGARCIGTSSAAVRHPTCGVSHSSFGVSRKVLSHCLYAHAGVYRSLDACGSNSDPLSDLSKTRPFAQRAHSI